VATEPFVPNTDELLAHNAEYAAEFDDAGRPVAPRRRLAVVACMDSRMDIFRILGLGPGEAHILRNAGGAVTDDVIRSLCVSQRKLGTREVILLHHTDCGMEKIADEDFNAELEAELGIRPTWAIESFADPYADVRQSVQRLLVTPFLPHKDHIRGFVYDVATGRLHEVDPRP
jgi:carbonic anhydrase